MPTNLIQRPKEHGIESDQRKADVADVARTVDESEPAGRTNFVPLVWTEEHVVETAFGRMSNDIESIRACHVQNTLSQQLLGAEHVKAHANNRAEYYSVCIHSCGRVVNIWMFSI